MVRIFSDEATETTTFEALIRMGYSAEEARAILESAPQVSSARRLLRSCGFTFRRLVSEVEEAEFPDITELEDVPSDGEVVAEDGGVVDESFADESFVDESFVDETFEGEVDPVDTETLMDTLKAVAAMVDSIVTIAGEEPEPMTYDEALAVVESFTTEASANAELSGEADDVGSGDGSAPADDSGSDFDSFFASEGGDVVSGEADSGDGVVSDSAVQDDAGEEAVQASVVRVSHCGGSGPVAQAGIRCSASGAIELLSGVESHVFSSDAFTPVSEEEGEDAEELVATSSATLDSDVWRTYCVRPSTIWADKSPAHRRAWDAAFRVLSSGTQERSPRFWVAVNALASHNLQLSRRMSGISRSTLKRSERWSQALVQFREITGREPSMLDYPVVNHLYSKLAAPDPLSGRRLLGLMSRVCRILMGSVSR